jgi:predicted transcriptional regulator
MPKRGCDSFSKEVIVRILQILYENGKLKKTHLAGRARINYKTCIKYFNFLQRLEWISLVQDSQNNGFASITSEGVENLTKLKNEKKDIAKIQSNFSNRADESRSPSLTAKDAIRQQRLKPASKKIVLVDDDEDILLTYKLFLDKGDFEVRTFSDSQKAFELPAQNRQ